MIVLCLSNFYSEIDVPSESSKHIPVNHMQNGTDTANCQIVKMYDCSYSLSYYNYLCVYLRRTVSFIQADIFIGNVMDEV